ncbi:uncharacterized protein METZ01_LOCUS389461, partial [marine metagenome]
CEVQKLRRFYHKSGKKSSTFSQIAEIV